MALNLVPLVLDLYDGGLNLISSGSATLVPSAQLADVVDQAGIVLSPLTVGFHADASPMIQIIPTDNENISPSNWAWQITFDNVPGAPEPYYFSIDGSGTYFSFTASASGSTFTAPGSSFTNGTGVVLTGSSLPPNFWPNTIYYVAGASGDTFSLAESPGGSPAIDLVSSGSGEVTLVQYLSSLPTTSGGSPSIIPLAVSLGGTGQKIANEFSVSVYGGDPTGASDSTAAIQAAQAAAIAAGGGYVVFGPGTWMFQTITIAGVTVSDAYIQPPLVHFRFAGPGATILTPLNASSPLFQVQSGYYAAGVRMLGGFTVKANPSGSAGPAIDLTNARQWLIESPSYLDSLEGAAGTPGTYNSVIGLGQYTFACHILNPVCEGQRLGTCFIGSENPATVIASNNTVDNPLFESNTAAYMIDAAGTAEMNIYDGIIKGNTVTAAIRLGYQTRVRGVHFEANAAYTMDSSGDSNAPGACWLENNVYNSGAGTLAIPSSAYANTTLIGSLGSLSVTDATSSYLAISGSVLSAASAIDLESPLRHSPHASATTSGAVTLNPANGDYQRITLTGNVVIEATTGDQGDGQDLSIEFVQPSSGGPYTASWASEFIFQGGTSAPALSTTASAVDLFAFRWSNANSTWVERYRRLSYPTGNTGAPAFNVMSYGAACNGVTDDTAAVTAAYAAAAGGGTVVFPAGTVTCIRGGINPAGATTWGPGATVRFLAGITPEVAMFTPSGACSFWGLTFDLNKANTTNPGSYLAGAAVYAYNASGWADPVRLTQCKIINGWQCGLLLGTSVSVTNPLSLPASPFIADGCEITGNGYGIYLFNIADASVSNCYIHSNTLSGIFDFITLRSRLTGNTCVSNSGHGIVTQYSCGALITGNDCTDNGVGGIVVGGGSTSYSAATYFTVTGNTCRNNGQSSPSHGIWIDTTLTSGPTTPVPAYGTVTGNTCDSNVDHGIYLNNSQYVTVTGNVCNANGISGLEITTQNAALTANIATGNYIGIAIDSGGGHVIGVNYAAGNSSVNFRDVGSIASTYASSALMPVSVTQSSGTYPASAGSLVKANISGGSWTLNLPSAPPPYTTVGAKVMANATGNTNTLTVACQGSDVFEQSGGATSTALSLLDQAAIWQYNGGYWTRLSDDLPLSQLETVLVPLVNSSPSTATGATFNGSTNDAAAITASQVANQELVLPNGLANLGGSTVIISETGVRITGAGMYDTTLQANAYSSSPVVQYPSTFISEVEISDLTIDGNNLNNFLMALAQTIDRVTLRRIRFINFAEYAIEAGNASNYVIEDCVADGAGQARGTFFSTGVYPTESLILRRNKLRWLYTGISVGSAGYHSGYVEIDDNDIDLGWWLLAAAFTGPVGTVTYTSSGLSDTGASFTGIASNTTVRAMPVRQTGTFAPNVGTYFTDPNATYITNGVKRGEIVRSGTSFAVVSEVISQTALHVEEWLSQSTYQPVTHPAGGASYTVYGIYLGNITASTSTSLTVAQGAGHGTGTWYDLTGASVTPATGTLYEVLVAHPNYPVYCDNVTDKVQITNNRIRRGWSDGLELFGNRYIVTGNIVEDGQDEGIVVYGNPNTAYGSIVSNNIVRHNGTSGLYAYTHDNLEIAHNQYQDNGWCIPASQACAQVTVYGCTGVNIIGGCASNTGEATPQIGLALGATGNTVMGFRGVSNAVADIYINNTCPAAGNSILDCSGVVVYQETANGQFLRLAGAGSPTMPASPGSLWNQTDTGALWLKGSGDGTTGWVALGGVTGTPIGGQGAYDEITSTVTQALTATTWGAVSGAPLITVPDDGNTYRLSLTLPYVELSGAAQLLIGIGTSTSAILSYSGINVGAASVPLQIRVDLQKITGSGQSVSVYAYCYSSLTLSLEAYSNAPCELAAYRVA
jgi:parallel beta-helix repeat protein